MGRDKQLSHPAVRLLWDIAGQYHGDDNGRLLASWRFMSENCGWKSKDTLHVALARLLEAGFLFQTVVGHRPNKASWFALTWFPLAKLQGYDPMAERGFIRWAFEINNLSPSPVLGGHAIGPSPVPRHPPIGTSPGPMKVRNAHLSTPPAVHPLEKPSIAPAIRALGTSPKVGKGSILPRKAIEKKVIDQDQPETVTIESERRERESSLDPSTFDPVTGEFYEVRTKPKLQKVVAEQWVERELRRFAT